MLLLLYGGLLAGALLGKERRGALCVLIAQPLPDLRHLEESVPVFAAREVIGNVQTLLRKASVTLGRLSSEMGDSAAKCAAEIWSH